MNAGLTFRKKNPGAKPMRRENSLLGDRTIYSLKHLHKSIQRLAIVNILHQGAVESDDANC